MKPQEAIEILKGHIVDEHNRKPITSGGHIDKRRNIEALKMAISALEKQIPKKPIEKEIDNLWSGMSTKTVSCPNCKKQIVNVWSRVDYKPKFCHNCGQALDWSQENEPIDEPIANVPNSNRWNETV